MFEKSSHIQLIAFFQKTIVYHPKVKTGNWYEDQQRYKRDNLRHNTEYYHEYQEKPLTTVPDSVKWDLLFKSEVKEKLQFLFIIIRHCQKTN